MKSIDKLYDSIADSYDEMWVDPSDLEEDRKMRDLLVALGAGKNSRVLDVGCGTGLLLTFGVFDVSNYLGVDPSKGMLSRLKRSFPDAEVRQGVVTDVREGPFDFVIAMYAVASYMTDEELQVAIDKASEVALLMTYEDGYIPGYWGEDRPDTYESSRKFLLSYPGAGQLKVGKFNVTVVVK